MECGVDCGADHKWVPVDYTGAGHTTSPVHQHSNRHVAFESHLASETWELWTNVSDRPTSEAALL
jgi:hypothetical protein